MVLTVMRLLKDEACRINVMPAQMIVTPCEGRGYNQTRHSERDSIETGEGTLST